tara:strand:- start:280 stop:480 length:201 start_codon:yes stop_codon:yes gene_type:complete
MSIKSQNGIPIGGDETDDIECPVCGDTNTVYSEYGTAESDDSELGVTCNTCENAEFPEEGYEEVED